MVKQEAASGVWSPPAWWRGARLSGLLTALIAGLHAALALLMVILIRMPHIAFPGKAPAVLLRWMTRTSERQTAALSSASADAPDAAAAAACASDMVLIDGAFCPSQPYLCAAYVDAAEYRCARYQRGLRCRQPTQRRRYCIDRHEWPNRLGALPQVMVDWNEAKASCAEVGKRLCRRSEWVLACEGPKRLPYPWGYRRSPSPCNIDRPAIPFDVTALFDPRTREGELARLWQADRIGSHPDCVSGFGVFDLAGNVDEWTDNRLDDPHTEKPSTLNGGYWGPVRDTCRLTTKKHTPKFRFYQVGFRCCADVLTGQKYPPLPWIEVDPHRQRNDGDGSEDASTTGSTDGPAVPTPDEEELYDDG